MCVVGSNIISFGVSCESFTQTHQSCSTGTGKTINQMILKDMGKTNRHIATTKQNATTKQQLNVNDVHTFRGVIFKVYLYLLRQLYYSCDSDHANFKWNFFTHLWCSLPYIYIYIYELWITNWWNMCCIICASLSSLAYILHSSSLSPSISLVCLSVWRTRTLTCIHTHALSLTLSLILNRYI